MTVKEAIEILSKFPPETELVGYDGRDGDKPVSIYEVEELSEPGKPYIQVSVDN